MSQRSSKLSMRDRYDLREMRCTRFLGQLSLSTRRLSFSAMLMFLVYKSNIIRSWKISSHNLCSQISFVLFLFHLRDDDEEYWPNKLMNSSLQRCYWTNYWKFSIANLNLAARLPLIHRFTFSFLSIKFRFKIFRQ